VSLPIGRISDSCAFCESPLVAADAIAQEPVDRVAPFVLNGKQAAERLGTHLAGRWMAPESVRKGAQPEALDAVLVPFWCYQATVRSAWQAQIGIWWYRTETYIVMVDGKPQTRTRRVKETEWFQSSGTHVATYVDHLVSGSRGLPEEEANALEPFDLGRSRPFDVALLAGLIAERPSVDHAQARATASAELTQLEHGAIRSFLPGNECRGLENQTRSELSEVELVLLPVWIATFRYSDKVWRLLVNGQTGEVVGTTPTDWKKIAGLVGIVVAFFALLALIGAMA
jgi:hypothetical protein